VIGGGGKQIFQFVQKVFGVFDCHGLTQDFFDRSQH
jgi:hypothetical protein